MNQILILNPPSQEKHLRGNYCSNVSKGRYYYPAIDLLVQSGILRRRYEVSVCDAVADGLTSEEVLKRVGLSIGVLAVTGSSSRGADMEFFRILKARHPSVRLLVTGGYLLTQGAQTLAEHPFVDGVLLDWTSAESEAFFSGSPGPFSDILTRGDSKPPPQRPVQKTLSYPTPLHERFPLRKYHHPLALKHPFSVVLHSYGCPYTCDYCIYSITPYKARPSEEVLSELEHLKASGVEEVFFHDPTFGVNRADTEEFLNQLIRSNLNMSWFCQTRVDLMTRDRLAMMKQAGCHAIMFGVETLSEDLLREHERRITHDQTRNIYKWCRELGIQTLSYLVIGLPGDSRETILATAEFVKEIRSDYVSFNLAIPVIGTQLRENAVSEGLISNDTIEFDNSSLIPTMGTRHLSKVELAKLHHEIVRSFYFRPVYFLQRLRSVRSPYQVLNQLYEALSLLRRHH